MKWIKLYGGSIVDLSKAYHLYIRTTRESDKRYGQILMDDRFIVVATFVDGTNVGVKGFDKRTDAQKYIDDLLKGSNKWGYIM